MEVPARKKRRSFSNNKCKKGELWKGSAFVTANGKLYLFIRLIFLLG
ncbi:hypothetical protein T06_5588 [Trichinella sp. T6]|nr:hypothetical protein T06_5588 [Trichinella sp. T6]